MGGFHQSFVGGMHPGFGGFHRGFVGGFHPAFGGFHRGFAFHRFDHGPFFRHRFFGFHRFDHDRFFFRHRFFAFRHRFFRNRFSPGVVFGGGYSYADYPYDYSDYSDYGYSCYLSRQWVWTGYNYVRQLVRVCPGY
jgi:hypothetical protein